MAVQPEIRLPAFLRLDPAIGWRRSDISAGVEVDPVTQSLSLGYLGTRLSPLTDGSGAFGGKTLPTGVAVGPDGVIVVADPASGALLASPHQGLFGPEGDTAPTFVPLWPTPEDRQAGDCDLPDGPRRRGPYDLAQPRGVAFSRDGDLLVTDAGDEGQPGRLLVYTWPGLRVRAEIRLGGQPWDIAVDADGAIWIADAARHAVRKLDRAWRVTGFVTRPGALNRPRHLTIAEDGTLYIVDTDPDTGIGRLSWTDRHGRVTHLDQAGQTAFWPIPLPPPVQMRDGEYFVPGAQCLDHGPRLRNLTLDRRGRLPQGPVLRYTLPPGRRERKGTYVSEALDSETFAFAWHRMIFDMTLGDSGAVQVLTYTSASDLEPSRIDRLPDTSWSRPITIVPGMPFEALVQSPPGRYLWLRIVLIGDGVTSPEIRAIELSRPRNSSLRFLPAPFHEDPESRDFLDRFLSYFDTIFAEVGQEVKAFSDRIAPHAAPEGAFLAWVGSWFDIRFLAQWDDATRRAFVANAMDLHRSRGTIAGLTLLLRLHLGVSDPMPVLIEGFRLRHFAERRKTATPDLPDGSLRIGGRALTQPLVAGDEAHRFYVVAPAAVIGDDTARQTLVELVDAFKPAHTAWALIAVEAALRVGCQSTVGVDTILGGYDREPLGEMTLAQSAGLTGPPNRLPQLGRDTIIARH
ncbi:phage tail protein [Thalassococcus sp. BH17M4-6]|uniref:phage tail protein n=1 Tax=Thalassococcus sp. BH17M4-6 TaxID=3413148 RepID=UPI003BCD224A